MGGKGFIMQINIYEEIDKLKLHKNQKEGIALKKPLLLLLIISMIQNETDNDNKFLFNSIEKNLDQLIKSFGGRSTSRSGRPEQPFHHLNSSPVWDLHLFNNVEYNNSSTLPTKILRNPESFGYLHPSVYELLKTNETERRQVAKYILDKFWPETVQEDIVNFLMLDLGIVKRKRNHLYANNVLTNYRYKCAMCGFTGLFNQAPFGLDAAHIKWHSFGGPDQIDNGIALCKLHHWAFDRGAITILQNSHKITVSPRFIAQDQFSLKLLESIDGSYLGSYKTDPPNNHFLAWHNKNIFIS
jgi:putative restriction endonuclease